MAMEAPSRRALEAYGLTSGGARRSRLPDPCWTKITSSELQESVERRDPGISMTYVVGNLDKRTHGIRIPARDADFT